MRYIFKPSGQIAMLIGLILLAGMGGALLIQAGPAPTFRPVNCGTDSVPTTAVHGSQTDNVNPCLLLGSNVGIGTPTPNAKLDVDGDVHTTGSITGAALCLAGSCISNFAQFPALFAPTPAFTGIVDFVEQNLNRLASQVVKYKNKITTSRAGERIVPDDMNFKLAILDGSDPLGFNFAGLTPAEGAQLAAWGLDLEAIRSAAEDPTLNGIGDLTESSIPWERHCEMHPDSLACCRRCGPDVRTGMIFIPDPVHADATLNLLATQGFYLAS